jgi:hypothetical protein
MPYISEERGMWVRPLELESKCWTQWQRPGIRGPYMERQGAGGSNVS